MMPASTSNIPVSTPVEVPAPSRRVNDAASRLFHALFALCFALAYITGDSDRWQQVHVTLGYTLAGLLTWRVAWGLWGPRHARWGLLMRRLRALGPLASGLLKARAPQWSALPAQLLGGTVALLLLLIAPVLLSGYAGFAEWGGERIADAFGELHEALASGMLGLVFAHVALVVVGLLRRGRVALAPVLGGRVPGRGPDLAPSNHGVMAALMLMAVLGFWLWRALM